MMYDLSLIALFLLYSPKLLIDFFFKKKYRKSLSSRFFPPIVDSQGRPVIWLHGVSLGEIKALSTLLPHIRKAHPDAFILVTTVTETGQEQAKKSLSQADAIHYLPLDFSWVVKPFVRRLKPALLILVEGDYWYNMMCDVKRHKGTIAVVNGKMSEKSMKRYTFFKSLFSLVDHFCLQGESYMERFLRLGVPPEKITVTGNLKLDIPFPEWQDLPRFKEELSIDEGDIVLTIGSTHDGEEELLLKALKPLHEKHPLLKVLLVPRHPERFSRVRELIAHYPYVTLVDRMGVLSKCYRLSAIAIVGGSFVRGVGGHDVFEPVKMGIPTLFGPYMHKQPDLSKLVTQAGAGKMVPLEALLSTVDELLSNEEARQELSKKGKASAQKVMGSAFRTWKEVEKLNMEVN